MTHFYNKYMVQKSSPPLHATPSNASSLNRQLDGLEVRELTLS